MLEAIDGKFINGELASKFLISETPEYLGNYLGSHADWNFPLFEQLENILKNGASLPQKKADDESVWAKDARTIANYQRACTAPILAKIAKNIKGFTKWQRMLDLGGGPGLNVTAIIREHPNMTVTILDRTAVTEVALEYIHAEGLEQRISVIPGDFSHDDFGSGWNFIMATACLNFIRNDLPSFVKKIYQSLNKGGVFLCVHDGMINDRTNLSTFALSWLPVAMMWKVIQGLLE